jgi:Methylamine utilisation protein MauE
MENKEPKDKNTQRQETLSDTAQKNSAGIMALLGVPARAIFGLVLIYSAILKITGGSAEFAYTLNSYDILSPHLVLWASRIIPWAMLYMGGLILVGIYPKFFLFFGALIYIVSEAALVLAAFNGSDIFVSVTMLAGPKYYFWASVLISFIMIALGSWAYMYGTKNFCLIKRIKKDDKK